MKKCLFLTVALTLSVFSLFTTSCDNNDEPNVSKPVATLAEVGEENSKTATAGKDMHLEGNLEARRAHRPHRRCCNISRRLNHCVREVMDRW